MTSDNTKKILDLLKTIEGNGSFETSGIKKITTPGLNIKGIGEISIPISPAQINEIIKISKKAPFGKGSRTVTDSTVRSAWELDAALLSFQNEDWKDFMDEIVENVKTGLGLEKNEIRISLYKLLIYEKGDFFLSHKDSEKEPGMFGTLIVGLPSNHTGGELQIRFDGKEKINSFSEPSSNYKIPFIAFFADCEHEIKPITSGYRVSLVFNLIQSNSTQQISLSEMGNQIGQMSTLLLSLLHDPSDLNALDVCTPIAILLEHQYTPANFSFNSLKHHDKPRAELILEAANKAGYYAELGLVTHYKMGELEDDGYDGYDDRYGNEDNDSDDATMGEVFEEYTTIEHWSNGLLPSLGTLHIDTEDLIADFEIGDDNPIEKDEERYTGNAGMTVEYWYHYGAVILWPKSEHLELLDDAEVSVRLNWLEYYYQNWDNESVNSIENGKHIISQFNESELTEKFPPSTDFSVVARFLTKLNDEKFIIDNCEAQLVSFFENISVNNWIELLHQFDPEIFTSIFDNAANKNDVQNINYVLEILKTMSCSLSDTTNKFFHHQVALIPVRLATIDLSKLKNESRYVSEENKSRKLTIKEIVIKVIELSKFKETDSNWMENTLETVTKTLTRNYVNDVLVAVVTDNNGVLSNAIKQKCVLNLIDRTAVKPTPPPDWKREMPVTKSISQIWNILRPFIESPHMQIFEYRSVLANRTAMEEAIASVTIDFKMETIRKGSPHVLKITKTQAEYEGLLKKWGDDVAILSNIRNR